MARWFDLVHFGDSSEETKSMRRKLLAGLATVLSTIQKRESWREVITRRYDLDDEVDATCRGNIEGVLGRAYLDSNELVAFSVMPGWAYGWRNILKDEYVNDTLGWLLHYSRQYFHRAWLASLMMSVYESSEQIIHPFSDTSFTFHRYSDANPYPGKASAIEIALNSIGKQSLVGDSDLPQSHWMTANTLDPHIQQCIAHYIRSIELENSGHTLDSVVAYDCVIQSCGFLLQDRGQLKPDATRKDICKALGLNEKQQYYAEFAYFIRNQFGAHPRGWRWWDARELLDDEYEGISDLGLKAVTEAVEYEKLNRAIDMEIDDYSDWFMKNFRLIIDATWFTSLASWHKRNPLPEENIET